MRSVLIGMGGGLLIAWAWMAVGTISSDAYGQRAAATPQHELGADGEHLLALSCVTSTNVQQIVLIDKQRRVLSVYHVESQSGAIALKSVRNCSGDMLMDEFNTSEPKPQEIRAVLEQR
ncbi:MAG: hypothetical protein R3E01_23315 [Pirellulaceae bacterium]|nr:hypothetical protein [Planctomycetales bacterium]MCA9266148.1 hypothetical protein [Planctomycetales bacterium]